MSELTTTTLPPPAGGGRFPFLIGILLVANLAVISNVRMGSVYLNQLKSVLLPQNENNNMPMDDVRALVQEVVDNAIQKEKENNAVQLEQSNDKNELSATDKQETDEAKPSETPAEEQPKQDEEKNNEQKKDEQKVDNEPPVEESKSNETSAAEQSTNEEVKKDETPAATVISEIDNSKPDRKSTRLNSSHRNTSRMPSSA